MPLDIFLWTNHYFVTEMGKLVWILGAVDNISKDFRLKGSYGRNNNTLRKFLTNHIGKGNNIIIDGWFRYNFLG